MKQNYRKFWPSYARLFPASWVRKNVLSLFIAAGLSSSLFAQGLVTKGEPVGSVSSFTRTFKPGKGAKSGTVKSLPVSEDQNLNVIVHYDKAKGEKLTIAGEVKGSKASTFNITFNGNELEGKVILLQEKKAYRYYSKEGKVYAEEVDINKLRCVETPAVPDKSQKNSFKSLPPASSSAWKLQSLPGAAHVIYLDFDGQKVVDPEWNGGQLINAQASPVDEAGIIDAWRVISEDYSIYKLNVTTDSTVFNAAPQTQRKRVIFTPTDVAAPGWGGVADIGSFTDDDDTPSWVYNGGIKVQGETGSHEIGHVLNLYHDGESSPYEEYHEGNGFWGPIMGDAYDDAVSHFSIGEYSNANNTYRIRHYNLRYLILSRILNSSTYCIWTYRAIVGVTIVRNRISLSCTVHFKVVVTCNKVSAYFSSKSRNISYSERICLYHGISPCILNLYKNIKIRIVRTRCQGERHITSVRTEVEVVFVRSCCNYTFIVGR
jgi:hypothetical protein